MPEPIHPYWGDKLVNKKAPRGLIKPWTRHYYNGGSYVIVGTLFNIDGTERREMFFRTSTVIHMNADETECETLNSVYRLEK